jgi:hypothetical protein
MDEEIPIWDLVDPNEEIFFTDGDTYYTGDASYTFTTDGDGNQFWQPTDLFRSPSPVELILQRLTAIEAALGI